MTPQENLRRALLNDEFPDDAPEDRLFSPTGTDALRQNRNIALSAWMTQVSGQDINAGSPTWQQDKDALVQGYFKNPTASNVSDDEIHGLVRSHIQTTEEAATMAAESALIGAPLTQMMGGFSLPNISTRQGVSGRMPIYKQDALKRYNALSIKLAPYRNLVNQVSGELKKEMESEVPTTDKLESMAERLLSVNPEDRPLVLKAIGATGGKDAKERASYLSKLAGAMGRMAETMGGSVESVAARLGGTIQELADAPAAIAGLLSGGTSLQGEAVTAKARSEESAAMRDKIDNLTLLTQQIRTVADQEINPIKGGAWYSQIGIDVARMIPQSAVTIANPALGMAANWAYFENTIAGEAMLQDPKLTLQQARSIAGVSAPLNAAVETVTALIPFGRVKLPFIQKWLQATATSLPTTAARFGVRAAVGTAAEIGEEYIQAWTPLKAQKLLGALQKDMPAVDWENRMPKFADIAAQTWGPALVFSLVGAGSVSISEVNSGRALAMDRDLMVATGIAPSKADTIAKSAESNNWRVVDAEFRDIVDKPAVATDTEKAEATQRFLAKIQAHQEVETINAKEAEKIGGVRIFRDDEGWNVELADGSIIKTDSADAARRYRDELYLTELDHEAESMIALSDDLVKAFPGTRLELREEVLEADSDGLTLRSLTTGKTTVIKDAKSLENLWREASAVGFQSGKRTAQAVLGDNFMEFGKSIARVFQRGRGSNDAPAAITAMHEVIEAAWKKGVMAGQWSVEGTRQIIATIVPTLEAGIANLGKETQSQELLWLENAKKAAAEGDEDLIREVFVEMAVRTWIGRDRDGNKTGLRPGTILRALNAAVLQESDPENITMGQKVIEWFKSIGAYLKGVIATANIIRSAERDGTIDDFTGFLDKVLGIETATREENEVKDGVIDMAFSLAPEMQSRAKPQTIAPVTEMPDGAQLVGPSTFSIQAYHGTPHKVDKFSTAKIGTGEGAQAYGWGLYFAENKGVAADYQKNLNIGIVTPDGKRKVQTTAELAAMDSLNAAGGDYEKAFAALEASKAGMSIRRAGIVDSEIAKLREWQALGYAIDETGGNLYTVELLPDADEFLDWDRPLSEQSEKVQGAWRGLFPDWFKMQDKLKAGEKPRDAARYYGINIMYAYGDVGGMAYEAYADRVGQKQASKDLAKAGIPGIRYLDGGSRGAGEGTSNYVIFDENLVKILEENGKTVGSTFSLSPQQFLSEPYRVYEKKPGATYASPVDKVRESLAELTESPVMHETNLAGARKLLSMMMGRIGRTRLFVTNDPALALGQGGAGIKITFNPARLNGNEPNSLQNQNLKAVGSASREFIVEKFVKGAVQRVEGSKSAIAKLKAEIPLLGKFQESENGTSLERVAIEENGKPVGSTFSISPNARLLDPIIEGVSMDSETEVDKTGPFKTFKKEYATSTSRLYRFVKVGEDDKTISGMVVRMSGPRSKKGVIEAIYTDPAFRRQGHAASLLRYAQREFDIKHSKDLTDEGRAFKKADGSSYSLSPQSGIDIVSDTLESWQDVFDKAAKRNPARAMAIRDLAQQRINKLGEMWAADRWTAKGDKIRAVVGKRTKGSLDDEQAMREALRYQELLDAGMDTLTPETLMAYSEGVGTLEDDPLVKKMLHENGRLMSWATASRQNRDIKDQYNDAPWIPPQWYSGGKTVSTAIVTFKDGSMGSYDAAKVPAEVKADIEQGKATVKINKTRTPPTGGIMPDVMANNLGFDTASEMWAALESSIKSHRNAKESYAKAEAAVKAVERQAREQAKAEAAEWRQEADDMQADDWSPRESLVRDMRVLNVALSAFPPEVRAKVTGGSMVKLAGLATERARYKAIKKALDRAIVETEKFMRKEYTAQVKAVFARYEPDAKSGEKPKGKLGPDVQEIYDAAKAALGLTAEQTQAELARLDSLIAADGITPEQELNLTRQRGLVELMGDWKNADSGRMAAALEALEDTLSEGWASWKLRQILIREGREESRKELRSATKKKGLGKERDAMRDEAATTLGKASSALLNLSSFSDVMKYAFGAVNKAKEFISRERIASNAYEDAIQVIGDRVQDFFTAMGGGSVIAGERIRYDLAHSRVKVGSGDSERNLTQMQGIQALLMWQQEDGRRHMEGPKDENGAPIEGKWSYDETWIADLESKLTPEAKSVKLFLQQLYSEEWAPLNAIYRDIHGINLPRHDLYAPLTVKPQQAKAGEMVDPVSGAAIAGSILTPGSLRSRNRTAQAEPDFRDALAVFLGHSRQMEHWKNYYNLAVDLSAVLGNREVMNAVEASIGGEGVTVLRKWIDAIAQGGFRDAAAQMEISQIMSRVAGRAATVALLGRVSTLLVQSTQLAAASVRMPVGAYLKRLGKLTTGNLSWGDAIKSDFIQRRIKQAPPIIRQAMNDLGTASRPNAITAAVRYLGNLLSGADGLFTGGTYAILLDWHRTQGAKMGLEGAELEAYAHDMAATITEEVAQPVRMANRSLMELTSTNPLAKVSWAYSSEARQKIALFFWSAKTAKSNPAKFGKTAFLTFIVGGLVSQVLKNLWREAKGDDDEKKWSVDRLTTATLAGPLHGIPMASEIMGNPGQLSSIAWSKAALEDVLTGDADMQDVQTLLSVSGYFNDNLAGIGALGNLGFDFAKIIKAATEED